MSTTCRAKAKSASAWRYPPATYARLAEVKRRYDPDTLFRVNENIRLA